MLKEIQVGDKSVPMLSNAATPIIYHRTFKQDLIVYLQNAPKDQTGFVDVVTKLAFVMHMQACKATIREITEDRFFEWLGDFEGFDFITASDAVIRLYTESGTQMSHPKKA